MWTSLEQHWLEELLVAVMPAHPSGAHPGIAVAQLGPFWLRFQRVAPMTLQLGLRAAVWVLIFSPLLLLGRPRLFTGLDAQARNTLMERAYVSRIYLLRQMLETLKMVACLAGYSLPALRQAAQDAP